MYIGLCQPHYLQAVEEILARKADIVIQKKKKKKLFINKKGIISLWWGSAVLTVSHHFFLVEITDEIKDFHYNLNAHILSLPSHITPLDLSLYSE